MIEFCPSCALSAEGSPPALLGKQRALDAVQPASTFVTDTVRCNIVGGLYAAEIDTLLMTLVQHLIERPNRPPEVRADKRRTRLRATFIHRVIPRLIHNIW